MYRPEPPHGRFSWIRWIDSRRSPRSEYNGLLAVHQVFLGCFQRKVTYVPRSRIRTSSVHCRSRSPEASTQPASGQGSRNETTPLPSLIRTTSSTWSSWQASHVTCWSHPPRGFSHPQPHPEHRLREGREWADARMVSGEPSNAVGLRKQSGGHLSHDPSRTLTLRSPK